MRIGEVGLYDYLRSKGMPGLKENVEHFTLKKGSEVYSAPQRYTNLYEIVSGAVKLGRLSAKGKECIYEILTPGEIFGNLAVLNDMPFDEFSKTLTGTEIRSYNIHFFKEQLVDPAVTNWFYPKIVSRWYKTETILFYIRSFEPRKRIQQVYLDLRKKIFTAHNREIYLDKLISYSDIADLTATTRQLVAETLKEMSDSYTPHVGF